MYLNPAYTGVTYEHRFVANYRNQWPGISKAYQTYMASYDYNMASLNSGLGIMASYDYNLSDLNSGIGVSVMQDRAGTAGLTHTQFGVNYAYHFKVSKFAEVRMGANLNYNMKRLDFNKLKFNDQINSGSNISLDAANYDRVPLPVTISLHGGYRFIIEQKSKDLKRYISPAFNFRHQQKYDQLDIGVYYYHLPLNVGLWYRGLPFKKYAATYSSRESVAVLVGFDISEYNLRVGYSYDITVSKLGISNSLGAHEISLIYEVAKKKKRNKRILVSCPKF